MLHQKYKHQKEARKCSIILTFFWGENFLYSCSYNNIVMRNIDFWNIKARREFRGFHHNLIRIFFDFFKASVLAHVKSA